MKKKYIYIYILYKKCKFDKKIYIYLSIYIIINILNIYNR